MLKKIIYIFLVLLTIHCAHGAQIVNPEYIHSYIHQKWDISIPYNPSLTNPRVAANMKYLLTAVDVANKMLGGPATNYGMCEYATMVAADTIAANTAIENLIKLPSSPAPEYKFFVTSADGMKFTLSAAGTFYLDCGDGKTQVIEKNNTESQTFKCSNAYDSPMKLGGLATAYSTTDAVIKFDRDDSTLENIEGCLGCIFPTLSDGSQPLFTETFASSALSSIPENLFDGITGDLMDGMFVATFLGCPLSGPSARINGQYLYEIWPNATIAQVDSMYLFADGLDDYNSIPETWGGALAPSTTIKDNTFAADIVCTENASPCTLSFSMAAAGTFNVDWGDGTTQTIQNTTTDKKTFSHTYTDGTYLLQLSGLATAHNDNFNTSSLQFCNFMNDINCTATLTRIYGCLGCIFPTLSNGSQPSFEQLFFYNTGLTGTVPAGFFAGIHGAANSVTFFMAFSYTSITGFDGPIFDELSISNAGGGGVFDRTFQGCRNLTGPSAQMKMSDGSIKFLYEAYPNAIFDACYQNATGLSDYNNIPSSWLEWNI